MPKESVLSLKNKVKISVIIPTYNEENLLEDCLQSVVMESKEDVEIIIVDGASQDRTLEIAKKYPLKIISLKEANLAKQLNTGAKHASGEILFFLHADCQVSPGSLDRLRNISIETVGGAFTMEIQGKRFFYKILTISGNIYSRLAKRYFGDRGVFIQREIFDELKGYREMAIMTDLDFSNRMKKYGKTKLLQGPILSSSRKFDKESPWRILYLLFFAVIAFRVGVDPEKIKKKYYGY